MIPELRRKINDSYIGQKINHTIPGILVEGASRGVSDSISAFADNAFCAGVIGADICSRVLDNKPLKGTISTIIAMAVLAALKLTNENAKTLYSHTSPLYRKTGGFCSEERMERVPLKEALIRRIYNEPEATALVMRHVYGRDDYAAYLKRNGFQPTGEQKNDR